MGIGGERCLDVTFFAEDVLLKNVPIDVMEIASEINFKR